MSPLEYFRVFFSEDVLEMILMQTNNYARDKTGVIKEKYKASETEQFLGMLLHMSFCKMPSLRMYWSNECCYPPVADVIVRCHHAMILTGINFSRFDHF